VGGCSLRDGVLQPALVYERAAKVPMITSGGWGLSWQCDGVRRRCAGQIARSSGLRQYLRRRRRGRISPSACRDGHRHHGLGGI